jgi:hypothetical protein
MRRVLVVALLLSVTSLVLGATVLREPFAWAAAPFQNVIVTNDTANPVPVAVGNLPAVQNVAVTNETANPVPVTVGNLPAVQNVAVQAPELWGKRVSLAGTNPAVFICPPAGKKFIVQSFSAGATVPEGPTSSPTCVPATSTAASTCRCRTSVAPPGSVPSRAPCSRSSRPGAFSSPSKASPTT